MTLSRDAIANVRHRIEQQALEIDNDPSIRAIRVTVLVNERSHRVRAVTVDLSREYDPAPEGVILREALDKA